MAQVWSLAWEFLCALDAAKKKKKKIHQVVIADPEFYTLVSEFEISDTKISPWSSRRGSVVNESN